MLFCAVKKVLNGVLELCYPFSRPQLMIAPFWNAAETQKGSQASGQR